MRAEGRPYWSTRVGPEAHATGQETSAQNETGSAPEISEDRARCGDTAASTAPEVHERARRRVARVRRRRRHADPRRRRRRRRRPRDSRAAATCSRARALRRKGSRDRGPVHRPGDRRPARRVPRLAHERRHHAHPIRPRRLVRRICGVDGAVGNDSTPEGARHRGGIATSVVIAAVAVGMAFLLWLALTALFTEALSSITDAFTEVFDGIGDAVSGCSTAFDR